MPQGLPQNQSLKRVCVGIIATAHGVKGLVKIKVEADNIELLNGALFTSEKGKDSLTLKMKNSVGKYWLASIDGISDRDAALDLSGTKLWIGRDTLPELKGDDEFYFEDLIGLDVKKKNNKSGESGVGKIVSVENFGAGDLLEIRPSDGDTFFIAFTKRNVPEINIKDGYVVICEDS